MPLSSMIQRGMWAATLLSALSAPVAQAAEPAQAATVKAQPAAKLLQPVKAAMPTSAIYTPKPAQPVDNSEREIWRHHGVG